MICHALQHPGFQIEGFYHRSVNSLLTYSLVLSHFFFSCIWYFLLGTSNPNYSVGISIGTLNVLDILRIMSLMTLIFMGDVRLRLMVLWLAMFWWIKSESFLLVVIVRLQMLYNKNINIFYLQFILMRILDYLESTHWPMSSLIRTQYLFVS